jgi:PiT family inorganic phosphate transporter
MDPIIIMLLAFALALAIGIGSNDETMSTMYGSGVMKLKYVVILGGSLAFIGCLLLSKTVGETIGANLLGDTVTYNYSMMLSIIVSAALWLIIASKTGMPISTTHSVVGAVFGIGISWSIMTSGNFLTAINWDKMGNVVLGWFISPVLGFFGAYAIQWITKRFTDKQATGLLKVEKVEKSFVIFLILSVCLTQLSRGGNDSANAIGIFFGLVENGQIDSSSATLFVGLTGLMMGLGIIVLAKNVIKNVGGGLVEMRPSEAFSIQMAVSVIIFIAALSGLPTSGTHVLVFGILGASRVKGTKPDKKSFRRMVIIWFATFPIAAFFAALFYGFFMSVLGI